MTGLIPTVARVAPRGALLAMLSIIAFSAVNGESGGTDPGTNGHSMKQDTVCIRGLIYVAGNEPFTELVVEREEGSTAVIRADGELYRELWLQQGQALVLYGIVESDPVHGTIFRALSWEPSSFPQK